MRRKRLGRLEGLDGDELPADPHREAVCTKQQGVVLFAGDTITGGKQNRVINVTMWLAANTTTRIPGESCLEAHFWDSGSHSHC